MFLRKDDVLFRPQIRASAAEVRLTIPDALAAPLCLLKVLSRRPGGPGGVRTLPSGSKRTTVPSAPKRSEFSAAELLGDLRQLPSTTLARLHEPEHAVTAAPLSQEGGTGRLILE